MMDEAILSALLELAKIVLYLATFLGSTWALSSWLYPWKR
jgi:hypothetical protein